MAIVILIVTPTREFGELIRQTLAETGIYRPVLVSQADEALARLDEGVPGLVMLDADLPPVELAELAGRLQPRRREFPLILIAGQDQPLQEVTSSLSPQAQLSKPFYLPALLGTVGDLLAEAPAPRPETGRNAPEPAVPEIPEAPGLPEEPFVKEPRPEEPLPEETAARPPATPGPPPWLQDVSRAAQYLTRLSLESSAQAALILRDGQLWAYAGQLPQSAAQELAECVRRDWEIKNGDRRTYHSGASDLARFVHLQATASEYMIYATGLVEGMVLALAFEAEVPFSQMRLQAGQLARALAEPPAPPDAPPQPAAGAAPYDPETAPPHASPWEVDEDDEEDFPFGPLFPPEIVPPPTPSGEAKDRGPGIDESWPFLGEDPFPEGLQSAAARPDRAAWQDRQPESDRLREPDTGPGRRAPWRTAKPGAPGRAELPVDEWAPLPEARPVLYSLYYACVLVPRMPRHYLTGDLGARLGDWVRRLNLAFGWRLEHLAIRPDYLLLISSVSPETSPAELMRTIRQQTSRLIFDDFPPLAAENPSGDFWAPGYLLLTTSRPPPAVVLRDFVAETRRVQGLSGRDDDGF